MSLSQIELVWVRVRVEWECFWVNLREDNKVSESKMAVSESNMGSIQDGCHHQVESEWMNKVFLCKWLEPILASVSKFERKYYHGWIQDGRIQDVRIQDGCHHQFKWDWIRFSWTEIAWVRVRVEWECFWVNLREDNKVSESKMAVSEPNMTEFKMAVIIKLSLNEWVKFFCVKWLNPRWQISRWLPSSSWVRKNEWSFFVQMVGTNLGKCEWVWEEKLRWPDARRPNSRWQN